MRARAGAFLALATLFIVLVAPAILTGLPDSTSEAKDESGYHLPVIRTMAEQWPRVDLVNYNSATTPGYHLFLAAVLRATGGEVLWLRAVNGVIGLGLALVVFWSASRWAPPWGAVALTLPFVLCQTTLSGAIWLTTDNAALLFVALVLSGASMRPFTPARGYALGALAAAAAGIRQVHAWTAAPVALAALLASPLAERAPRWVRAGGGPAESERSWNNLVAGLIGAAAPVVLVVVFAWMWGGLIPHSPLSREFHGRGPNPATFAFGLALFGALGLFFAPVAIRSSRELREAARARWVWIGAGVGLFAAVVVPTSTQQPEPGSPPARGFGVLWRLADIAPDVAERSTLLALFAAVGGALAVVFYRAAVRAGRGTASAVLLLSLGAWLMAQSMNSMAWQRYFEPLILIALAWLAALAAAPGGRARLAPWLGPLALAGLQAAVSALAIYMRIWFE